MADELHSGASGKARLDFHSLEQRIVALEVAQKSADNSVAQLTVLVHALNPLVGAVQAIEAGQHEMQVAIADFTTWSKEQRAEDAAIAESTRIEAAADAKVRSHQLALEAARAARHDKRMRWLRPLLQYLGVVLAIILGVLIDSLREPIGAYIEQHLGWGWTGVLLLAILVALVSLGLAIRAA